MAVFIEPKEHGALEAIALGQDARDGRAGFLAAIFVVAGDKDDVFALARPFGTLINQRTGHGEGGKLQEESECDMDGFHFLNQII